MSQLNLKLSTVEARAQLHALDKSLDSIKAKLSSFGGKSALDGQLAKLAAFKGVEQSAIASLSSLANTMGRLSSASSNMQAVARGLNSLARIRVDAVAANLDRMSRALASFRVPPSMARFATDLAKISSSASLAAQGITRVARALNTIKAAPGLSSAARSFERIGASAAGATTGLMAFSRAGTSVTSVLSGFGIVLGGVGLARFVQSTLQAVSTVDQFKNSVAATQGGMAVANREWEYAEGVASRFKISIEGVAKSYGSFSAAASLAGVSTENIHKIFEAMSMSARVLNMDAQKVENSFKALEQMFSKGTVGAEELRQQLGDALPGAMQLMAQAVGVSTGELMKMMQAGEVLSSSALPAFADILVQKFGPGLAGALTTAGAAMTDFQNVMFKMSESFGRGFFDSFKGSLSSLASVLSDPSFVNAATAWGQAFGTAMRGIVDVTNLVVQNFGLLKYAALAFIGLRLGAIVTPWATALSAMAAQAGTVTRTVAGMTVTIGGLSTVAGFGQLLRGAFMTAAMGARTFMLSLGPIGIAIAALTIGIPALIDLYRSLSGSASSAAGANQQLAGAASEAGRQERFAAEGARLATGAMNQANGSARSLAGGFNTSAAAARNAADAYYQAAAAARAAAASAASAATRNSVVKPSAEEAERRYLYGPLYGDSYSGGGVVGKPTFRPGFKLPASAFNGAPHFQGGGVTGGGIPAVLHPNEAVVPLAGGGSIPVQNMSGGQSALLLYKPLKQLLDSSRQIKVATERVWEATTVQTILTKNSLDRLNITADSINNRRLPDIHMAISALGDRISSSGGGVSGGGVIGGGISGFGGDKIDFASLSAQDKHIVELQYQAQLAKVGAANLASSNAAKMGFSFGSGLGRTPQYQSPAQAEAAAQARAGAAAAQAEMAEWLAQFTNLNIRNLGHGGGSTTAFASGSPNAFKDAHGGFTATLHPDEAVIPLPDGRSVPVTFQSDILDRVSQFMTDSDDRVMRADRTSTRSGAAAVVNNVSMVVYAKDADSFRQSSDQMMRDLQTKLDRATRRTGRGSDIDDPTRRL